jgi:hypothetical protein
MQPVPPRRVFRWLLPLPQMTRRQRLHGQPSAAGVTAARWVEWALLRHLLPLPLSTLHPRRQQSLRQPARVWRPLSRPAASPAVSVQHPGRRKNPWTRATPVPQLQRVVQLLLTLLLPRPRARPRRQQLACRPGEARVGQLQPPRLPRRQQRPLPWYLTRCRSRAAPALRLPGPRAALQPRPPLLGPQRAPLHPWSRPPRLPAYRHPCWRSRRPLRPRWVQAQAQAVAAQAVPVALPIRSRRRPRPPRRAQCGRWLCRYRRAPTCTRPARLPRTRTQGRRTLLATLLSGVPRRGSPAWGQAAWRAWSER